MRKLRRSRDLLHIFGDVHERSVEIELLLITRPADGCRALPANCEHRHVVLVRIVEAGDEVGRSGSAGGQTDAELAGELGIGDRHEGRHFLVPRLDEIDSAVMLKRTDDAVDAVAGVAEDPFDAPGLQPFDKEFCCVHDDDNAATARMLR